VTEESRIARFVAAFDRGGAGVVAGPGDDNALTRPRAGRLLVTKVDQVVEGVHFGPAFRPEEIGHKALAVSLSDLCAAGATPRWMLVAIALRKDHPQAHLDRLARGMSRLARTAGIALVGGNFTVDHHLSLAVTAIGDALPGRALRREGARAGDVLLVSGELGGAALGLRELARGRPRRPSRAALRQLRPAPRLALAPVAGRFASASVDVSDGLLRDLGHLCRRSGVGARLELDRLPLERALRRQPEGEHLGLTGGEDYELLLAVPPRRVAAILRAAKAVGERLTPIGVATRERSIVLTRSGRVVPTPSHRGWDPFGSGR
jgi:thiamine-monophosphate kinase